MFAFEIRTARFIPAVALLPVLILLLASCGQRSVEETPGKTSPSLPVTTNSALESEELAADEDAGPGNPDAATAALDDQYVELAGEAPPIDDDSVYMEAPRLDVAATATVGALPATAVAPENPPPESSSPLADSIEEYTVQLRADERLSLPGLPGELVVWIGNPDHVPPVVETMVQAATNVPAVGESATVAAYARGFVVEPAQTQCIGIHPRGSEVRFTLTPTDSGTFPVSANVALFRSADCSGTPIPRTTATLTVAVDVDRIAQIMKGASLLFGVFWEQLLTFWGAVLALFFGLALYLIRNKLKKLFGYDPAK